MSISSKGSCSTVNRCNTLNMSSGTGARMMMGLPALGLVRASEKVKVRVMGEGEGEGRC